MDAHSRQKLEDILHLYANGESQPREQRALERKPLADVADQLRQVRGVLDRGGLRAELDRQPEAVELRFGELRGERDEVIEKAGRLRYSVTQRGTMLTEAWGHDGSQLLSIPERGSHRRSRLRGPRGRRHP